MSLGGIAIAIGAMVDAAIVLVENAHKRLEKAPPTVSKTEVIIAAAKEVGPSIFYSLLIITIAFLPIFALTGRAAACSSRSPTPKPSPCFSARSPLSRSPRL